jgi:hydroxymethylpyrimidine pyrophosphatase-like HAD family hydrolase
MTNDSIHMIVFDIDGVLTWGEAHALDLSLLGILAGMNKAARIDSAIPAVTLCTGRPAPYVEMMLQAIDGHLPGIFENGAGMYVPNGYRFLPHPDLSGVDTMRVVRQRLGDTLVRDKVAYFQPGKEYTLTLFSEDPENTEKLSQYVGGALGTITEEIERVYSTSCLNILPRGVHKGKGIEFLAQLTGIDPAGMLGVGDSDVDLEFLQMVGYSAAPANANANIKKVVQYVSTYPNGEGVQDILAHFGLT